MKLLSIKGLPINHHCCHFHIRLTHHYWRTSSSFISFLHLVLVSNCSPNLSLYFNSFYWLPNLKFFGSQVYFKLAFSAKLQSSAIFQLREDYFYQSSSLSFKYLSMQLIQIISFLSLSLLLQLVNVKFKKDFN